MKLLVLALPFDHGRSGISVYIREVVRHLRAAGHELALIVEDYAAGEFDGYELIKLPRFCDRPLWNMLYVLFILPFRLDFRRYDRVLELAGNRRVLGFTRMPNRVTLHDLSQYHVEAKYDAPRMFYVRHVLPFFVRKSATAVEAVSRSTATDAARFWRIPEGKTEVNHNGFNIAPENRGANDASGDFILCVSRLEEPGKNHLNLLKAYELLPEELSRRYRLKLVGADWTGAEQIHRYAQSSPLHDQIDFAGFLSEKELYECYRHASLFAMPSRFEGFGLPLVEAMASGCICCCSRTSSLGEIAEGGSALTFDPESPEEIAEAMYKGLTDNGLRAELRRRGLKRAEDFSWERHVERLTGSFDIQAQVLGTKFLTVSMTRALELIDQAVESSGEPPAIGCFVNTDCLNQAFVNPDYAGLLARSNFVFADGVGAAWAAKRLYTPCEDNVNGTDMLPLLCAKPYRLYLVGGASGVAETARQRLSAAPIKAEIVGAESGYFPNEAAELAAVERINASGADILLVGMGVPRQEMWMFRHRAQLKCRVMLGVGGLFDFASGRIPRAPQWMRRMKLEWLFRFIQEPRRLFKRYFIGNPRFIFRVWRYGGGGCK